MSGDGLDRAMAAPNEWPITTAGPVTTASSTSLSQAPYQDRRPPERPRASSLSPGCPGTSGRTTRCPASTSAEARGRDAEALKFVPATKTTVTGPDPAVTTWVRAPWAVSVVRSCGTCHASSRSVHQRRTCSRPAVLR